MRLRNWDWTATLKDGTEVPKEKIDSSFLKSAPITHLRVSLGKERTLTTKIPPGRIPLLFTRVRLTVTRRGTSEDRWLCFGHKAKDGSSSSIMKVHELGGEVVVVTT